MLALELDRHLEDRRDRFGIPDEVVVDGEYAASIT